MATCMANKVEQAGVDTVEQPSASEAGHAWTIASVAKRQLGREQCANDSYSIEYHCYRSVPLFSNIIDICMADTFRGKKTISLVSVLLKLKMLN